MFWTLPAAGFCLLTLFESKAYLDLIVLLAFLAKSQYSLGEGV